MADDDKLRDALRRALHAYADAVTPSVHAIDHIRDRTARLSGYSRGHDLIAAVALLLILLFTLGGS
jgi:hypothetical protein